MRFLKNLELLLSLRQRSFEEMSRQEQERAITTMCKIVTIGTATVLVSLFYPFIPPLIRLFSIPAVLFGSLLASNWCVSILLSQFEDKLNYRMMSEQKPQDKDELFSLKKLDLQIPGLTLGGITVCLVLFVYGIVFNHMN